ncbi:MAG: hypothetical protein GDA49_12890 [Rhodospirillales bacterium]|nr:hypothetical protein [Rhodospirillales bacterium]
MTEPTGLHDDAKRYPCTVEPDDHDKLSEASIHTMSLQGGIMEKGEAERFAAHPHCADAAQ